MVLTVAVDPNTIRLYPSSSHIMKSPSIFTEEGVLVTSSKIFVCSNCRIETHEPDEIKTKCEFHPNYIVNGNSVSYMCCGSYIPGKPCKSLEKHCWKIKD